MLEPEEVDRMIDLHRLGWGIKRIARELGVAKNTVKRYVAAGGWVPYQAVKRAGKLKGLEQWMRHCFEQHRGNCDVVRQELARAHGIAVSLRTVERACQPWRSELTARARATVRFETPPGRQMQIDFGQATVEIGGQKVQVHLFVATLGYSRLNYVAAFRHQRQSAWFAGMEGAFAHFGGVPQQVLIDNAKPLVVSHDVKTREVVFNERFSAFARHWGFTPKACAPYRARTKGKDESGVGYVKNNALAGHRFDSWEAMQAHLARWLREVADVRIHGTTKEAPRTRFERDERGMLAPLAGRPPYQQAREWVRVVSSESCVEVDTNRYSVPWRLIGETLRVRMEGTQVVISYGRKEVARHDRLAGRHARAIDAKHFEGLVGRLWRCGVGLAPDEVACPDDTGFLAGGQGIATSVLIRPLAEYEALVGGGF